jgi:signal transduction histidine kinase
VPLEISFGEFSRNGRRFFTGIARDITERRRAQDALRKSREERLAELERVRKRIATDLHDDIGSSLTRISLLGEVVSRRVGAAEPSMVEPLSSIASLSRELVDSMSDIVWAINPDKDHLSDLSQRMRRFASDVLTARQIEFRFLTPDHERDVSVGANHRRELFLVFKEAINNMVRHSGCSRAELEFRAGPEGLVLIVSDNGSGFDVAAASGGHGLASMRERIEALGGTAEVVSHPGQGTLLAFAVPLSEAPGASKSAGAAPFDARMNMR